MNILLEIYDGWPPLFLSLEYYAVNFKLLSLCYSQEWCWCKMGLVFPRYEWSSFQSKVTFNFVTCVIIAVCWGVTHGSAFYLPSRQFQLHWVSVLLNNTMLILLLFLGKRKKLLGALLNLVTVMVYYINIETSFLLITFISCFCCFFISQICFG